MKKVEWIQEIRNDQVVTSLAKMNVGGEEMKRILPRENLIILKEFESFCD